MTLPDEVIEEIQAPNGVVRVVDDEGHLLFIYNPYTRCIEFIPVRGRRNDGKRKVLCIVSTDKLRSIGSRNVISDSPIHEFVAEVEDVQDEIEKRKA